MLLEVFENYSQKIKHQYIKFLQENICDINDTLLNLYLSYAILDNNFPRPILTFLGVNYKSDKIVDISSFKDFSLLFVPQMIRDFGAIHDDIIDEDVLKFNTETLPVSFSKMFDKNTEGMTKIGKDFGLLFGDYIVPHPYQIVLDLLVDSKSKLKIIGAINNILKRTNIGQMQELLYGQEKLTNISKNRILTMYKAKAADYCYAFPFEIGLIYSKAPKSLIEESREILLQIGSYSQIVNDLEGVFSEDYNNERDTLTDLIYLRRSYLLIKLAKLSKNDKELQAILQKQQLTQQEALFVKQKFKEYNVCANISQEVELAGKKLKNQIAKIKLGSVCKNYFGDLIDIRIISNLKRASNGNALLF